jgi:thiamine biosynthesis lipoprotein
VTTWRAVEQVMGLPISVALRGRHAGSPSGDRAWAEVVEQLRRVDRDFSPFRPDSWVSRIDREEADLGDTPAEVREVMTIADAARDDSNGAFDVWRADATGRLRFDPSGVVKGWAVQRASASLRSLPDTDFCLSGGGDLVCEVHDPGRPPWQVGIEDPHDPRRLVATVPVRRGAVATSGLTHRGGHVRNARTGQAPTRLASVTVVADDLVTADVAATTALALDEQGLAWLRERPCLSAVVVMEDGRRSVVDGLSCAGPATQGAAARGPS